MKTESITENKYLNIGQRVSLTALGAAVGVGLWGLITRVVLPLLFNLPIGTDLFSISSPETWLTMGAIALSGAFTANLIAKRTLLNLDNATLDTFATQPKTVALKHRGRKEPDQTNGSNLETKKKRLNRREPYTLKDLPSLILHKGASTLAYRREGKQNILYSIDPNTPNYPIAMGVLGEEFSERYLKDFEQLADDGTLVKTSISDPISSFL